MTPLPSVTTSSSMPVQADALVAVLAEDQRLAVLEHERVVSALMSFSVSVVEGAVVEDVAVLEDLDERRALVRVARADDLLQVLGLDVDRCARRRSPRRRARREIGLNGWSTEPSGVDLVILPSSEVGEYWPLVRP